ncbi:hypothetical protein HPB49_024969 [Dermacentor silvarum]|uniref:Uncharacterized protein n=1 Tax=Dermacentor silvarum TaxID=543639 RepID=A0ACB8D0V9_DERSI|nr:hypothetical protein HPB49_024969 [Dermacentor silvarum]
MASKSDKARNLLMTAEGVDDLLSPEDNEVIKAPKNKRRRGRKKDKRDKRRERKDKKKRLNAEDSEGLEDARELSNKEDELESEVAWSPVSVPKSTEDQKQELGFEIFFDMMNEELEGLRDNIETHERQLLDFAAPLVCRIPQPPKPYITRLCCCTKCCGRCCDIYGHQKKVLHPPLTSDVGTDSMEADLLENSTKRIRKKRPFTVDMDLDTTTIGYGGDFTSSVSRKGSAFKLDSIDKDTDADTLEDSATRIPKGGRRHLAATRVVRKTSQDLRRTSMKTNADSASGASTPASDLLRKARMSRKGFTKRLSCSPQRKPQGRYSPRASIQYDMDGGRTRLQDSTDVFKYAEPFDRPALLADQDDRSVFADDTACTLGSLGESTADWQSPAINYDPFFLQTQSASQYFDNLPTVGRSELLYYTDHPASPLSGEVVLRAVQSSPVDVYSMRMTPEAPSSYARQGPFNENLDPERSSEPSLVEDDRSSLKPSPSLAVGPKIKTKPAEAEAGGEASKSEGRPRARFANLPTETAPKNTGIRRRGSVFVSGNLLPDEDDEGENKISSMKATSDESFAKKCTAPSDADWPPPNSVDAVQRLKLSISSLSNVQSKRPDMDNEPVKRQDLTSFVNKNADGAKVTVKKWGSFLVTDMRGAPGFTEKNWQRPHSFETKREDVPDGKNKLEGATITDVWRKQDVVTVCDRSTCISRDRATATPEQWENPQVCPLPLLDPCRYLSTLSFLSSCSKCAPEDSEESDTFVTPRSMTGVASASQTTRYGSKDSPMHSDGALIDSDSKVKSSRKRRPPKIRSEKHKRKHSADNRHKSPTTEEEPDDASDGNAIGIVDCTEALRNVDDLHEENCVVTTKLSDTLLDVGPVMSPVTGNPDQSDAKGRRSSMPPEEESGATGRRASVSKKDNEYSKNAPTSPKTKELRTSESTGMAPTATKHRREIAAKKKIEPVPETSSRRASQDPKPCKNSAKAEEEEKYSVLTVEPTPPQSGEATPTLRVDPDIQRAARENPGGGVPAVNGDHEIGELPALKQESPKVSAAGAKPMHASVKKIRTIKSAPTGAAPVESFPARVGHEEIAIEEGVSEHYDLQENVENHNPDGEEVEGRHVEGAKVEHHEYEEMLSGQSAKPTFLQIPEPEAQLAAVVSIPFEGDRKFWFYKDSTVSLYPESTFGVTAAFVCAGWIILLMFLTEMHHGWFAINSPTTSSSAAPTLSHTVQTQPYSIPPLPETWEPPDITVTSYPPIPVETGAVPQMDTYYCATAHCDKEARYLSSFVLGDPCENFYEDICVNRTRMWSQPAPGAAKSTNSMMAEQIQASVLRYINDDRNNDVRIARNLLSACVHEAEQERVAAVKSMVSELLGVSWPIDRSYEVSLPNPWEVAGKLARELNLEPLAALSIDIHPEKAGVMVIGLDEPSLFQRRSSPGVQLSHLITTSVREAVRMVTAGPEVEETAKQIMETMFTICDLAVAPSVRYFGTENYRLTPLGDMEAAVKLMLDVIFLRYTTLDDGTEILVKSPSYFERLLRPDVMRNHLALLNYMGYRVFLLFAAFTSSSALQEVHSILVHRPTSPRDGTRLDLCVGEVEHVLPAMYVRAFFRQIKNTSFDTLARVWSSKVEQVFQRGLSRLSWFRKHGYSFGDSFDLRLANHKLSTSRVRYFYPNWIMSNASYAAYAYHLQARLDQVRGSTESSVKLMRALYEVRFAEKIEPFVDRAAGLSFSASTLDASPHYDVQKKSLFVPAAVINASVPTNGSMFAFHIARYGVRLIKGLMPVLYNDFVFSNGPSDDAPLLYTQGYDRRLRDTVKCLVSDYIKAPDILKSNFMRSMSDVSPAGFSLLEQTVALMAAYWAFQELLTVKRVWRSDFRFAQLPDLSSDQLFFLYYALDNCERSDDAYQARAFDTRFELPPEERVNFPLLQMDAFKHAFGCRGRSPMATASQCSVAF